MSATIHLIRHGQGEHNVPPGRYDLPDPKLTKTGEEQCLALRNKHFPDQSHISLITASPLTRAINSAYVIFQPTLESKFSPRLILAIPDVQETTDDPCDVGSDPDVLKHTCEENHWPVDLSLVSEGWNDKDMRGRYSGATKALETRARDARLFLRQQARDLIGAGDRDVHIVLVSHGGFLHFLTEDWENSNGFQGTGWVNCETRAYTFEHGIDSDEDGDAHLVETMESRRERGLDYPMFSKERQRELFVEAMQGWEDQGVKNPNKIIVREDEAVEVNGVAGTMSATDQK